GTSHNLTQLQNKLNSLKLENLKLKFVSWNQKLLEIKQMQSLKALIKTKLIWTILSKRLVLPMLVICRPNKPKLKETKIFRLLRQFSLLVKRENLPQTYLLQLDIMR